LPARGADERHRLAPPHGDRETLERRATGRCWVAEADILEGNGAVRRIGQNHRRRRGLDVGHAVEQLGDRHRGACGTLDVAPDFGERAYRHRHDDGIKDES
jgi:hypothetical protein